MNDFFLDLLEKETVHVFLDGRIGIELEDGSDHAGVRLNADQARQVANALLLAAEAFDEVKEAKP